MTKRILALVMTAILAVTMLTFPAFASFNPVMDGDTTAKTLTVKWGAVENADRYVVVLYRGDTKVTERTEKAVKDKTEYSWTYSYGNNGGNYNAQIFAYNTNGRQLEDATTNNWYADIESKGSSITITADSNGVKASWTAQGGVSSYYVEYSYKKSDGKTYSGSDSTGDTSYSFSGIDYNNLLTVKVYIGTTNDHQTTAIASWTNSNPGGGNGGNINGNGITLTPIGSGMYTASWNVKNPGEYYAIAISNSTDFSGVNWKEIGTSTSYTFTVPNSIYSVYVMVQARTGYGSPYTIGYATIPGYNGGSGNNGTVYASRSSYDSVELSWPAYNGAQAYVIQYAANNGAPNSVTAYGTSIRLSNCNSQYNWVFSVYPVINGSTSSQSLGMAYLAAGSSNSGSNGNGGGWGNGSFGGLTFNKTANSTTVSWYPVNGAIAYFITHKRANSNYSQTETAMTNSITLPYGSNDTWTIDVMAVGTNGNPIANVGSATVSPLGDSQNNNQGNNNSSVVNGNNCVVYRNNTYATVKWNSTGSSHYTVFYYVNGDTSNAKVMSTYTTSITLDVSITDSYIVTIVDANNKIVGSAEVKATSNGSGNNSGIDKTEIKNLTVTPINSFQTKISWNKVPGVSYYKVMYGLLDSSAATEDASFTNSFTIPFNNNKAYQVYVYAVYNNNSLKEIGHVYNVPGSTPDTDKPSDTAKDYVTNLKGVSGDKKVTLSWTAADGAKNYTIYFRRAGAEKWSKAGSVSKTAVNLRKLTNGVTYEFKVVANGNDSGIVKIKVSKTSSTVYAPDPEDDDITLGDELRISKATSSSKGTATITWNAVDGATGYRIYVAEGSSSTYRSKGTFTGTSATITGLTSGKTYKVRVVKVPVDGDLKSALQACPYAKVTVK